MIELRTKKIEKGVVTENSPTFNIRMNLENNNIRVSQNLYDKLELSVATNFLGLGLDRENGKYYICVSNEKTGFKPNAKNLTFTSKKVVQDLIEWFFTPECELTYGNISEQGVMYLEIASFINPVIENDITFYEVSLSKVEKLKLVTA